MPESKNSYLPRAAEIKAAKQTFRHPWNPNSEMRVRAGCIPRPWDGFPFKRGDVALLPHGTGHALADTARGPTKPLGEFPLEEIGDRTYRLRAGGGAARALLFCCSVNFEEPAVHPLLELMPPVLLVRAAAADDSTLPALLDAMAEEVIAQRVDAATVLTRLADVVIVRVIRAWVENRSEDASGWRAAIRDPKIGRALGAIHRRPGHPWSVEALAEVALMSRSIFSERFTSLGGMPPAQYLARWRMHLASVWLRNDRITVAEVADRLGYESEASFSRAFKRRLGVPPSSLRRFGQRTDGSVAPERERVGVTSGRDALPTRDGQVFVPSAPKGTTVFENDRRVARMGRPAKRPVV